MKAKSKTSKPAPASASSDNHKCGPNEVALQKIMGKADKPLSAYDLIPLLGAQLGHKVAPITVYRALQHLATHGLVTRIETQNAYVLCQHPHESHECLFFICRTCGKATEAPDGQISKLLRKEASEIGFGINKQVMEIIGLCKSCSAAA